MPPRGYLPHALSFFRLTSHEFYLLRGYTAPEYAVHGQLSEKVDTYSFGVVVLEIISGRRCNEMSPSTNEYLVEDVSSYILSSFQK